MDMYPSHTGCGSVYLLVPLHAAVPADDIGADFHILQCDDDRSVEGSHNLLGSHCTLLILALWYIYGVLG